MRAVAPIINDWTAVWGTDSDAFGSNDDGPLTYIYHSLVPRWWLMILCPCTSSIGNRAIYGFLEIAGSDETSGASVILGRPYYHGEVKSQGWMSEYLGT